MRYFNDKKQLYEFIKKQKGLKILHVGNIANNAYQNAKMLNKLGLDCDVLSYDYYHAMGCPEWDDSGFSGEIENMNFPEWKKVDLHGFKRPKWFISGPLWICIQYSMAKRKKRKIRAFILWKLLEWTQNEIARNKDSNNYTILKLTNYKNSLLVFFLHLSSVIMSFMYRIFKVFRWSSNIKKGLLRLYNKIIEGRRKHINVINQDTNKINSIMQKIENDFKNYFPDKKCEFGEKTRALIQMSKSFKDIFNEYDVVFAYATNPIWLYLIGYENYIAYEHGTIRDLPYEEDEFSKLMLLAYAKARAIYVTNVDCYDSAKYIAKALSTPIVCGLHGIDIDTMIQRMEACEREQIIPNLGIKFKGADIIFFCPSRHSWDEKLQLFLKGQDKVLRAAKKILNEYKNFKIILVRAGNDVDKVEKIIEDINLEEHVIWIDPVQKLELYKIYIYSDAVIDQFFTKSYGAITFEVLAAGSSLISIDANEQYQVEFFGDTLPYFACRNEMDIYNAMKEVIERSNNYCKYTSVSREWVREHHSNNQIISALCEAIRYCA